MQRVYKYEIAATTEPQVLLPVGSRILSVHEQHERIYLWAMVNVEEKVKKIRHLRVYGTGHDIPQTNLLEFIGTVHMMGGNLVFHIFESIE